MKDLPQRKPLRLEGYDYSKPGYYFVTICTALRGQNILSGIYPVGGGLCPAPSPGVANFSPSVGTVCSAPSLGIAPSPGTPCPAPVVVLTPIGHEVDKSIRSIPERYPGVQIDCYCIMPDHVHLIAVLPEAWRNTCETGRDRARPLQDIIGTMKSYTARQYRTMGMPFEAKLWQTSYYDHIIRNEEDLRNTRQYILDNPLKWISDHSDKE